MDSGMQWATVTITDDGTRRLPRRQPRALRVIRQHGLAAVLNAIADLLDAAGNTRGPIQSPLLPRCAW